MAVKKKKRKKLKPGAGKAKGASFERKVCKDLSLWVSGGTTEDCFWRSAMSGGRATVGKRSGKNLARQAGDISSVSPEGHVLTDKFFIECKFLRNIGLTPFLLTGGGTLDGHWRTACREAVSYNRLPILIAKQNLLPTIVVALERQFERLFIPLAPMARIRVKRGNVSCSIYLYDELMQTRFIGER